MSFCLDRQKFSVQTDTLAARVLKTLIGSGVNARTYLDIERYLDKGKHLYHVSKIPQEEKLGIDRQSATNYVEEYCKSDTCQKCKIFSDYQDPDWQTIASMPVADSTQF